MSHERYEKKEFFPCFDAVHRLEIIFDQISSQKKSKNFQFAHRKNSNWKERGFFF